MSDQFAHPESEEDLVGLVQEAVRQGRQLRVRGAGHSAAHAIYTDPRDGLVKATSTCSATGNGATRARRR